MVTLYKALQGAVNGHEMERRGLDVADDPHGYGGSPGTTGKSGAYFTIDLLLAIRLVPKKDYHNGVLVVELGSADYAALQAAGGILPDPYLPQSSVRVQPTAFLVFNGASSPPKGSRAFRPPGFTFPGGPSIPS